MSGETQQNSGNVVSNDSDQPKEREQQSTSAICSPWLTFCRCFHSKMEKMFASSSTRIANHPKLTIFIGLVLVGCLSIGFIWFKIEKRTVKIFIPQNSQAMKDLANANKHFKLNLREESIILIPVDGKQVLSTECFKDALKIHDAVIGLPSYKKLCAKIKSKKCILLNPLELFNFEEKKIINVSSTIKENTACPSSNIMSNGRSSCQNLNRMLGSEQQHINDFSQVKAIRMAYYLDESENDDDYSAVFKWEGEFMNTLSSLQKNMTCVKVLSAAERTLDDAIDESSSSDTRYFALTFTLMINFANIVLGKMCRNPLTGHSLLGTSGVVCVGLGVAAGFGLSLISQTPFVKIVGVLPFLVVGVAIDDMFIILDDLDRESSDLSVTKTVSRVMARTGPTVTMTTVTDLVAFAVSTSSQFPSIQYFCTYAALTITFSYLLIVTVFVALMSFDVRRVKANRRNCLPFCFAPPPKEGSPPWDAPIQSDSSRFMEKYGQHLMKPSGKVIVVLLSLGLLAAGIYGTIHTNENFDRSLLVRDGSPYKEFLKTKDKYFDDAIGFSVVVDQPLDYSTKESQEALQKLGEIIKANKYCKNETISWIDGFKSYCSYKGLASDGSSFFDNLRKFLNEPFYRSFASDIKLSDDNKNLILASRVTGFIKGSGSSVFQRDAMLALREDLSTKSSIPVYPIARAFIFLEQYAIIVTETIRNLSVASLTIFIVMSPFLVDIIITLLVVFSFASLVFELFGLMVIWGVSLNSISMINLVMAIGFSVDYTAHIALAFLKSKQTTSEGRVVDSLKSVGASVALGGISTLIGISLTALSNSEIFRIFFKMFFGIVVLGLLHGLLFLPVYLGIFGKWSKTFTTSESRVDSKEGVDNLGSNDENDQNSKEQDGLSEGKLDTKEGQENVGKHENDKNSEKQVTCSDIELETEKHNTANNKTTKL